MSFHHASDNVGVLPSVGGEYSGDERDSRSGGEERSDIDLNEKPTYLLEHLATFTVNKESGIVYPADGMRRLLQLEKTTGIWSQKMQLCLDYRWVLIMDYETGNIIERFPASLVQEPTAFTSADAMDLYNNILVFIVSGGSGARSEMHIFQSQSVSASHLVEDLKNLRSGKLVMQQRESLPPHLHKSSASGNANANSESRITRATLSSRSEQHQQHHQHHQSGHYSEGRSAIGSISEQYMGAGIGGAEAIETDCEHGGINDETSSTSSDKYERDVTVLNHCFDDIEKFIARLQHMAAASRELERRRRNRKSKKKDLGEGLLTLRTRPPHEKEFIDIFAKFKLSFNLLAKLKAHIHDPNAPELVHFLFTPLALIVEAASDHYFDAQLPARVINPLLTREAINLLINCVTSKETELWRSLGEAWVIPRDQWKDDVGSYHPVFLDGWSPDYLVIDEHETPTTPTNMGKRRHEQLVGAHTHAHSLSQAVDDYAVGSGGGVGGGNLHYGRNHMELLSENDGAAAGADYGVRNELCYDSIDRRAAATASSASGGALNNGVMQAIASGMQNLHTRETRINTTPGGGININDLIERRNANDEHLLESWLEELQAAGAKIVLVTYPRTANNDKELSVVRGEYLEILDDTRKWWKARNIRGQVAHVPHTIVTLYNFQDIGAQALPGNQYGYGQQSTSPQQQQQQQHIGGNYKQQQHQQQARHAANDIVEERGGAGNSDWVRNKHLGKKGEFRYF